jgi:hypothetical protein
MPEKFRDGNYEGSDEDCLRDFYRCYLSEFESYEKFVENLTTLKGDPSARSQILQKVHERSFCYFDLAKDPEEVNPVFINNAVNQRSENCFQTIMSISNRSSGALNIFDEIDHKFLEDIAEKLLITDQKATIQFLSQNKHLLNEMIDRILLDSTISDKEFIRLLYEIFLRRTPKEREIEEAENLFRQGVTRRLYFNNRIFNNRVFGNLRTLAAAEPNGLDLLELAEYKQKYEEIQKSLIFKLFSKAVLIIDNILFPPQTKRRALLDRLSERFREAS